MIRKTLGYVLAGLGVVGIAAWMFPSFKASIPDLQKLVIALHGDTNFAILSGALLVVGLFILVKAGGRRKGPKQLAEVPIFQGKNIVGYRRH